VHGRTKSALRKREAITPADRCKGFAGSRGRIKGKVHPRPEGVINRGTQETQKYYARVPEEGFLATGIKNSYKCWGRKARCAPEGGKVSDGYRRWDAQEWYLYR